jgi:hypothetical protein
VHDIKSHRTTCAARTALAACCSILLSRTASTQMLQSWLPGQAVLCAQPRATCCACFCSWLHGARLPQRSAAPMLCCASPALRPTLQRDSAKAAHQEQRGHGAKADEPNHFLQAAQEQLMNCTAGAMGLQFRDFTVLRMHSVLAQAHFCNNVCRRSHLANLLGQLEVRHSLHAGPVNVPDIRLFNAASEVVRPRIQSLLGVEPISRLALTRAQTSVQLSRPDCYLCAPGRWIRGPRRRTPSPPRPGRTPAARPAARRDPRAYPPGTTPAPPSPPDAKHHRRCELLPNAA